ncbi:hypothetical protein ACMFMG_008583 [Clarireedia jacksonii]
MSTSTQTSPFELTGISEMSTTQDSFEFQGETYPVENDYGNFEADCDGILLHEDLHKTDLPHRPKVGSDGLASLSHLTIQFAGPPTAGRYSLASSHADSNASIQMNRAYPTSASLSQVSGFLPTPSISEREFVNYTSQPDDSVSSYKRCHPQPSTSQFPTEISGPSILESWYTDPQRHEFNAYRLTKPAADLSKEKNSTKKSDKAAHRHK